jgi:integrase
MPRCKIVPIRLIGFSLCSRRCSTWPANGAGEEITRSKASADMTSKSDTAGCRMDELQRLVRVLDEHPNQRAANAVRLQLLTGARMGEVLSARKADFDLNRGVWIKPSHQTKQRRTEHLPLSAPAASLVASILQENSGSQYLFPGNVAGEHLTDIKKFWAAAIRKASIPDYRRHDNRHTYASHLVSSGLSLEIVGRLLGHTSPSTTKRYAHLADDPLRAATERFGSKFGTYST